MDHQALADGLAHQLNGVRRVLRRRLRAGFDGPGRAVLTGSQVELLQLVEAVPGIGVSAAAQSLRLAGNSVSTLVNQLTDAGLLRRDTDPADRRTARLALTEAATARLTSWRAARRELLATALADLSPEDRAALAAAVPALDRLTEALTSPIRAPAQETGAPTLHPSFLGRAPGSDPDQKTDPKKQATESRGGE